MLSNTLAKSENSLHCLVAVLKNRKDIKNMTHARKFSIVTETLGKVSAHMCLCHQAV